MDHQNPQMRRVLSLGLTLRQEPELISSYHGRETGYHSPRRPSRPLEQDPT